MSWWGKLAGGAFGFLLGGPLGALIGAAIGHQFDSGMRGLSQGGLQDGDAERVQMAFFTATFSVLGHIAKADGRVSRSEIRAAEQVMHSMNLSPEMREAAINLFRQGKAADFPLDSVLQQLRSEAQRRRNLLRLFIEIQLQGAFADGELHARERDLLLYICRQLGFSEQEFVALAGAAGAEQHHRAATGREHMSMADAYAILEVDSNSSDADIKRAYRRMMSRHHPDKLVAKGLPEEMMKLATEKTQEIRAAYERIRQARKKA